MPNALGTVTRALISVYDKRGLTQFAQGLAALGVEILASGGTARALAEAGVNITAVEAFTGAKEVLEGRVKTLHPRIHAGILADRRRDAHLADLKRQGYLPIDLVVCNLYPFGQVLQQGRGRDHLIENIDVGGPTMVRAAAKNVDGGVSVITDPGDYAAVLEQLKLAGQIPHAMRQALAAKAFRLTATYDLAIAGWAESQLEQPAPAVAAAATSTTTTAADPATTAPASLPAELTHFVRVQTLRYGENPHQRGALYVCANESNGIAHGRLLHGKALSYNNYLDMDAAYRAIYSFAAPACAIVKHTNPCGLAECASQEQAFEQALAGDPLSAFGSIVAFNTPLNAATAAAIQASKLFVECIVAPGFSASAIDIFKTREQLRLVEIPAGDPTPRYQAHRIGGGLLVQDADAGITAPAGWQVVTKKGVTPAWLEELAFAMRVVTTVKSNAIVVTKGKRLLGAGAGQMSRVDAVQQAIKKAGPYCTGAFLASDAFFPFADSVRAAAAAGIVALVQPGGSKRDQESIDACDELGLAMLFTGRRHFRH